MKTKKYMSVIGMVMIAILTILGSSFQAKGEESTVGGGGGGGINVSVPVTPVIPTVLPIGSQDEIRNYALSRVVRGYRSVSSQSIDWNYTNTLTWTEATGNHAEDVLAKLFGKEFTFRMTNPNDLVQGWVHLYDKDNNRLFAGYAETTGTDLANGVKTQYPIWIQEVPLLENVGSAEILVLNEDGATVRRMKLTVNEHGQLMFSSWYAGSPNGLLSVKFKDGTLMTYSLAKPIGETPESEMEVASYKIEGHYVYTNTSLVKIIEPWNRPTVFIEKASIQTVTFDVIGLVQTGSLIKFERPTAMIITVFGENGGGEVTIPMNADRSTDVVLPNGVGIGNLRIRFEWNEFGKPSMLYTGPMDGGGLG